MPGLRDNTMVLNDKEITNHVFLKMVDANISNAYITLYHSLGNDNSDIKQTLSKIETLYGKNIR